MSARTANGRSGPKQERAKLTVAVTGPTGEIGRAFVTALERELTISYGSYRIGRNGEPGGKTAFRPSATLLPRCGLPTEVIEATRSGRTEAT